MKGNYGDKPFRGIYPAHAYANIRGRKNKEGGIKKTGFLGDGKEVRMVFILAERLENVIAWTLRQEKNWLRQQLMR